MSSFVNISFAVSSVLKSWMFCSRRLLLDVDVTDVEHTVKFWKKDDETKLRWCSILIQRPTTHRLRDSYQYCHRNPALRNFWYNAWAFGKDSGRGAPGIQLLAAFVSVFARHRQTFRRVAAIDLLRSPVHQSLCDSCELVFYTGNVQIQLDGRQHHLVLYLKHIYKIQNYIFYS